MAKNQPSNATVVDKVTKRLNALKAYVDSKAQIPINGVVHKTADVIEIYQSCLDNRASLSTKRAEVKAAIVERASTEAARREADRALKGWVANQFGVTSQQAVDFGFPPPRAPTRTADDKALAVARAKATREARHTMGRRQKEQIKGTVLAPTAPAAPVNTAPTTAPVVSAPAATAQPAPTASPTPPVVQAPAVQAPPAQAPAVQAPPPQAAPVQAPAASQAPPPTPQVQPRPTTAAPVPPPPEPQAPTNGASAPSPVLNGSSQH